MSIYKGMDDLLDRWEEELETLRRHGATEAAATKAADIEDLRTWYRVKSGFVCNSSSVG